MRVRKFFFVIGSFKLGGTERTASRIGMELIKRGYDVKFILINNIFDYKESLLLENSIVLVRNKSKNRVLRLLSAWWKLTRLVWMERPDYLVSFSIGVNAFTFLTFYRRLVFRLETNIFIFRRRAYKRYIQKWLAIAPNVKRIVVPSSGLYERCVAYFCNPGKLVQVANPLPLETIRTLASQPLTDFPQLEEGRFIVSAGRLSESKGFLQLICAFARSGISRDFKLVILGEGPMRNPLEEMIAANQLQDSVVLGGYQHNPFRFFTKARFFVLNSAHESFGNVLIESMGCGVPVVSNDCDFGPRDIIRHGYNGLLYNRENEEEFIMTLQRLSVDDQLYRQLKEGAVEDGYRYDINCIVDFWIGSVLN